MFKQIISTRYYPGQSMKLDVTALRYLSKEDFDVLSAIEMGSRNHEVVPMRLISQLSKIRPGGLNKVLSELQKLKLITHDHQSKYEGVTLGYGGYDYLALRTLSARSALAGVGRQIGVGKESDIYEVFREPGPTLDGSIFSGPCIIKLQRLGRTSFRTIKNNRDYIGKRQHYSWLYLSKIAATKEFAFMKALYSHNFPVPIPIDHSRHVIVMEQIIGIRLDELSADSCPGDDEVEKRRFVIEARQECLDLIIRLAQHGLIHGDFNEFNLLIEENSLRLVMIDFPQMLSVHHMNAEEFFDRDVDGVCRFFERKFGLEPTEVPCLKDIIPNVDLDKQLGATGNNSGDCGDSLEAENEESAGSESDGSIGDTISEEEISGK